MSKFIQIVYRSILLAGFAFLIIFLARQMPTMGTDFALLYPAGQAVWKLQNPYAAAPGFYNPPWMLAILAPMALIDIRVARWVWCALGIVCYLVAFRRLRLPLWSILVLLVSPFVYYDLAIGNYEWLILLGASLPAAFGAWIILLKPQASIVLFGLWLKQRRWAALLPVVTLAALFALQMYALPNRAAMNWSADVWPYGIPVGIALMWFAFKRDDVLLALAAAPFLSPYVGMQTWIVALLPLTRNKVALVLAVLAGWVCLFLFASRLFP